MESAYLGTRTLKPYRQLMAAGGPVAIGKRALHLISRLSEAHGEVVTKDELIAAVWPGAIVVEDNALQAHIVTLRKALGPDAKRLKTVRGVGYSLCVGGDAEPRAAGTAFEKLRLRVVFLWVGGIFAAFAVAAGAVVALQSPPFAHGALLLDHIAATGGRDADNVAQSLEGEVGNIFNRTALPLRLVGERSLPFVGSTPEWRLTGRVLQDDGLITINLRIEDYASGTPLWDQRFEGLSRDSRLLAREGSIAAARTIFAIREIGLQKGFRPDPETIAMYLRGDEMVRDPQPPDEGSPRRIFEQIVARTPRMAAGHAMLALSFTLDSRRADPDRKAGLQTAAAREARMAVAIDPAGAGAAFDSMYMAAVDAAPGDLAKNEKVLLDGLRRAPGFAFLWMRECRFLAGVGRGRDSLSYCQRALALHPLAEPISHSYSRALWSTGDQARAEQTAIKAIGLNPGHRPTRVLLSEIEAFGGDAERARRLMADPATRPLELQDDGLTAMDAFLARRGDSVQLASQIEAAFASGGLYPHWAAMALAVLGQKDRAFDILLSRHGLEDLRLLGGQFLYSKASRGLRSDPRFWEVAARTGVARYWLESGKWPDVCGTEIASGDCRRLATGAVERHRR